MTAAVEVIIISRLGWPLTRPAAQLFKENRGAETSPVTSELAKFQRQASVLSSCFMQLLLKE